MTSAPSISLPTWASVLRLDLPVGPLKIDYGIPLQKDNNTNGPKVQFSVGYQF